MSIDKSDLKVLLSGNNPSSPSPAGTFRRVAQLLQRLRQRVAVVALDFEGGVLDRAACAELRFQLLEERLPFLLWYLESLDDRDGLSAPALPVKPDSRLLLQRTQASVKNLPTGLFLGFLSFPKDRDSRGIARSVE